VRTHRTQNSIWVAGAIALLVPLAGCTATGQSTDAAGGKAGGEVSAEPVVLQMFNPLLENSSAVFVDQVEKVSNGQLRIESLDRWKADTGADAVVREQSAIDAVRAGEAPLAMTTSLAWHDHGVRSFDALPAPMLIDRPEVQTAVLHSNIASDMLAGLDGSGLTGVGILPGKLSIPAGISHPLTDVADYQGAAVAMLPNAVAEKWLTSLGANHRVFVTSDEVESGAIAGFVDGMTQVSADLETSITPNVAFGPRPVVISGNTAALAALSDQNRTFLQDAARSSIDIKARNDQTDAAEAAAALCRTGTVAFDKADPAQLAALRASAEPVYQWLREDTATSGFLDRIQQISGATPVDPAVAAAFDCPTTATSTTMAAASAEPTTTGSLDGTYTSSVTTESEGTGLPPENLGEWVVVLDRGRFATTRHHDQDCTWAFGQFSIDGDTIRLHYEGGGGVAPPNVINKSGEELGFHWSLYRNVLTLTNQPDVISPLPEGVEWNLDQVSTSPDPTVLNPQCPPPAEASGN